MNTLTGDYSYTLNLFGSAPSEGLILSLTYDAQLAQAERAQGSLGASSFGAGWSSNFGASVTPLDIYNGGTVTVIQPNGSQATFNESADSGESTSCPAGDYSTTSKYTFTIGMTPSADQFCALASVQGQLWSSSESDVYQTDGGQNQEFFNYNGTLDEATSYSSSSGFSGQLVLYDVSPGGMNQTDPCPTTATDCTDIRSGGDDSGSSFIVEALNSQGLVTQVYDPSGVSYDFTYDSSGDLLSAEEFANQASPSTWYFVYDTSAASPNNSDLTEIYDPDSGATSSTGFNSGAVHSNAIVYNLSGADSGMVSSVTDGTGVTTTYSYGDPCATGQCVATNALQATTVTYPAQLPCRGAPPYRRLRLISYVGGVQSSTSLGSPSNSANNETWSYNWTFGYGAANSTEVITYPDSLSGTAPTATITLDPAGNVISTTNASGDVATSAYNDVGSNTFPELLWSYPGSSSNGPSNPPSGSWVYTYNTLGQEVTATDPLGNETHFGYYASDDDPCYVAEPTVSVSRYTSSCTGYGTSGPSNINSLKAPPGSTAYTYDGYGNVIVTNVDFGDVPGTAETTTASYSVMGDQLWSIPPTGQSGTQSSSNPFATVTSFTPANLPLTITKPGEASVTYSYDAALNQVSSARPAATTTTVYDGDNRPCYQLVGAAGSGSGLTCSSSPQAGSTSTTYVPASDNVLISTDGNGKSTSYYCTALAHPNSPTEVVDVLGTQIQYTAYNDFGNACVAGDVAITAQGTTSQCNTVAGDTATVYNALGDETSETDPSGNTTSYAYTNTAYPT